MELEPLTRTIRPNIAYKRTSPNKGVRVDRRSQGHKASYDVVWMPALDQSDRLDLAQHRQAIAEARKISEPYDAAIPLDSKLTDRLPERIMVEQNTEISMY
jgi:hypothetical protein